MSRPNDALVEALGRPNASFMCIDVTGQSALPDPGPLSEHCSRFLHPEVPVRTFHPDFVAVVITAFFEAQTHGSSSAIVKTADGLDIRAEFHDDRPRTDGVVVVMWETDDEADREPPSEIELPTRLIVGRLDASGQTVEITESVTKLLGWSQQEYFDMPIAEKVHPTDLPRVVASWADLLNRPGGQTRIRQRFKHRDGTWRWFETTQTNLLRTDDPHLRAESLDISAEMEAQTALQEREELLARLNEALPVGILHLRSDNEIVLANPMWRQLTRSDPENELEGFLTNIAEIDAVTLALERCRQADIDVDLAVTFADAATGECRHGELRVRPLGNDQPPFGLLLTLTDVTQSILSQETLWQLARNDHLTQVKNRFGIEEALTDLLADYTAELPSVVIIYFDLDNFKTINDRFGHNVGDEVLTATAEQLRLQLRPHDLVGRLGGDEFLAVLVNTTEDEARAIVQRFEQQLCAAGANFSDPIEIYASIGVATALVGDSFDDLVSRADAAMYSDKAAKKARLQAQ